MTDIVAEHDVRKSMELPLGIIVALLNIIEIILILRLKRKKIFEIVLISLSVADLLFGLSNASICVVFFARWRDESVFDATFTSYFFFVLTSIFHLIFIAIDRLSAIVRPIRHKVLMTRKKVYIILCAVWIAAVTTTLALYLSNDREYPYQKQSNKRKWQRRNQTTSQNQLTTMGETYHIFMQQLLSYFILVADSSLIILYAIIVHRMHSKEKINIGVRNRSVTQHKASWLCIFVGTSFVVFTLPYAASRLAGKTWGWPNLVLASNSGINSVIYFFRSYCQGKKQKNILPGSAGKSTPKAPRPKAIDSAHNLTRQT